MTYRITISLSADDFGGLLQVWNIADLHNPAETKLSPLFAACYVNVPLWTMEPTEVVSPKDRFQGVRGLGLALESGPRTWETT